MMGMYDYMEKVDLCPNVELITNNKVERLRMFFDTTGSAAGYMCLWEVFDLFDRIARRLESIDQDLIPHVPTTKA